MSLLILLLVISALARVSNETYALTLNAFLVIEPQATQKDITLKATKTSTETQRTYRLARGNLDNFIY